MDAKKDHANLVFRAPFQNTSHVGCCHHLKMIAFNIMCVIMEDDFELYTVKELHKAMEKLRDHVYLSKMTKGK